MFSTFYVISDKELNAQNNRILVKAESDNVDISSGCSPTNGLPTAVETIVLVKKGVYSCVQIAWLTYQAWSKQNHPKHNENIIGVRGQPVDGKKTTKTIQLN